MEAYTEGFELMYHKSNFKPTGLFLAMITHPVELWIYPKYNLP